MDFHEGMGSWQAQFKGSIQERTCSGAEQIPSAEHQFFVFQDPRECFISHLIVSGGIKQNFRGRRKPNRADLEMATTARSAVAEMTRRRVFPVMGYA